MNNLNHNTVHEEYSLFFTVLQIHLEFTEVVPGFSKGSAPVLHEVLQVFLLHVSVGLARVQLVSYRFQCVSEDFTETGVFLCAFWPEHTNGEL